MRSNTDFVRIIIEKRQQGYFLNKPLSGYLLPTHQEINHPKLYQISFVVTEQCNLRCSYCPYSCLSSSRFRSHSKFRMQPYTVDKVLGFFFENACANTAVSFYGGEPLLNFQLIKHIIQEIKRNKPDWQGIPTITSNFTIYSNEIADLLAENNFALLVSLDGPKEIHDRYRKTRSGKGTFGTIISHLASLEKRHPRYFRNSVMSNTVLTPPFHFDALNQFFGNGSPKFRLCRFTIANSLNPDFYPSLGTDIHTEEENLDKWALRIFQSCKTYEEISESPLLTYLCKLKFRHISSPYLSNEEGFRSFTACIPGHKALVKTDGSLSICDRCDDLIIGHVKNGIDPERSEQIIQSWQNLLGQDCLNCWASVFCHACYLIAWDGQEFNRRLLEEHCNRFRRNTERWLNMYLVLKSRIPHFDDLLEENDDSFID